MSSDTTVQAAANRSVSGKTTDEKTGAPVAGILVEAFPSDVRGTRNSAYTGEDGRFRIDGLQAGNYTLACVPPAIGSPWCSQPISAVIPKGRDLTGVKFRMSHGGVITGKITDATPDGVPIYGIEIGIADMRYMNGLISTDENGEYRLRVPVGNHKVFVFDEGWMAHQSRVVDVPYGKTVRFDAVITPPPPFLDIRGTVVDEDRKPVPGAEIMAVPYGISATSGPDGRFTFAPFQDLLKGTVLYARQGRRATSTAVQPKADGSVTLTLSNNALVKLQGDVRDREGKIIANAEVALSMQMGDDAELQVETVQTDATGQYVADDLYAGASYRISVNNIGGYENAASGYFVANPKMSDQDLIVTKADSFVGGMVVDPNGKPVAQAMVMATPSNGIAMTDAQGRFHITGVASGKVELQVMAPRGSVTLQARNGFDDNVITIASQAPASKALQPSDIRFAQPIDARALFHDALTKAAADKKNVFLIFHATQSGPCNILDHFLDDRLIQPVLDAHFVVEKIDIWDDPNAYAFVLPPDPGGVAPDNPHGIDLYERYGNPAYGVPFIVLLDPSGNKIGDNTHNGKNMGVPADPANAAIFLQTLKKATPSLTDPELAVLLDGLLRCGRI